MKTPSILTRLAVLGLAFGLIASSALRAEGTEKKTEKSDKAEKAEKAEKPVPAGVLKRFDKDGDGKLNDEEAAAWKAARDAEKKAMLEKYDADKNGKIDDAEKAAMKADREKKDGKKEKPENKEKKAE
jgi:hypothetical protein